MRLLYFQYHYSSYTKLPFPPHLPRKPPSFLRGVRMGSPSASPTTKKTKKDKVLVIVGATGCGKSSLSVDLASLFGDCEIINSDKMQVYTGLDVTTNKISLNDRKGIPHHLLGDYDPTRQTETELSPSAFRLSAGSEIADIASRGKLPIVAGGSNSFVHALLVENFDPKGDFFGGSSSGPTRLRYDCRFLWVDVSFTVLCDYLRKRVDEMLDKGMFEELERFFWDLSGSGSACLERGVGIMKAIGVPEFERYFRKYPPRVGTRRREKERWDRGRREAYEEAVREIKENTCRLARRQNRKILRLRDVAGWNLRRVDATASLKFKMGGGDSDNGNGNRRWVGFWEKDVVEPSVEIVRRFLEE